MAIQIGRTDEVGRLTKNQIDIVVIRLCEFNEQPFVDIRIFRRDKATKMGICIPLRKLEELRQILNKISV